MSRSGTGPNRDFRCREGFLAAMVVRLRARGFLLALAAGALAPLVLAAAAPGSPLKGDGMWIWRLADAGGSAESIASKAKREGYEWVAIKSGDGTDSWSQFTPELVQGLRSRGLRVCAWVFVYGSKPRGEARVGAEAKADGADCLIIDAESAYEGRYRAADIYIHKLRAKVGRRFTLGLTSFPYVGYHPALPYSVFLGRKGAELNVPQIYWRAIGDTVRAAYEHTYTWNRAYDRKIFPLGQTYQDPPRTQMRSFRRYANEYGAKGVSWWAWHTTSGREWNAGSAKVGGVKGFKAKRDFPELVRGNTGDTVLLVQQLLKAHRLKAPVSGRFNAATEEALLAFQRRKDLTQTGALDNPTWRQLIRRRPVEIRWSKRKRSKPGFARGSATARVASPFGLELLATPGRP